MYDDEHEDHNAFGREYIAHLPHQIEIINQHYIRLC